MVKKAKNTGTGLPTETVKINNDWWLVLYCDLKHEPGKYGDCDYDTRVIRIDNRLSKADKKLTLAHEIIHACYPQLTEEAVLSLEQSLRSAKII